MSQNLSKILYIDDDNDIRTVTSLILQKKGGFEVISKPSGRDGLAYMAITTHTPPDLILLDVMMPNMDGPTTLKALQTQYSDTIRNTPVVFLTAKCQPEEVERLQSLGAHAVLSKPFDVQTLSQQIASIWEDFHAKAS